MLRHEDINAVLARAQELEQHGRQSSPQEIEDLLRAAEEAGLSRKSVLLALREKYGSLPEPIKVGSRVFARSRDGHSYVADVLEVDEHSVRVRFKSGGELVLPPSDIQPCTFAPGARVTVPWPDWGWANCSVLSFDEEADEVTVTDGWSEETFEAAEVRLSKKREKGDRAFDAPRLATWIAVSAVSGGALGSLITWLFTR